jgi:hypothetical protein
VVLLVLGDEGAVHHGAQGRIAPAGTRRQASGPVRARFYLPAAAGIVVLVSALMLTRRVPRWAGALLVAIYIAFAAGGYLLYGTQPTGARFLSPSSCCNLVAAIVLLRLSCIR